MIKNNSKLVNKGDTFIAIKGINNDGHLFIEEAIKNGATKIIAEHGLYSVETIIVKDTSIYLEKYLYENYFDLIKDIKLIGVTGTNGKTTTSYLIYQALNKLNIKTAYIGTIGFYIEDSVEKLNNTTPELIKIYEMLLLCKDKNIEYVVMEVSSQALSLNRLNTLLFDYAIFTNLTQDHLDYHITMDNYALAKKKLFTMLKDDGISILNSDSSYHTLYKTSNCYTYGLNGDYKISDINSSFKVNDIEYSTSLVGDFNVYNLSVVITLLSILNIDNVLIQEIIKHLVAPPGRMEIIEYLDNKIVIDYAHTPDALNCVLDSIHDVNKKITVIGCGGNRDKSKRSQIGEIAVNNSDYVIFTNDNPRDEEPLKIIEDIIKNVKTSNYEIIENRQLAIKKGIQMLTKNDILYMLGKGHETYQEINNIKTYFSDKEEVLKVIGSD